MPVPFCFILASHCVYAELEELLLFAYHTWVPPWQQRQNGTGAGLHYRAQYTLAPEHSVQVQHRGLVVSVITSTINLFAISDTPQCYGWSSLVDIKCEKQPKAVKAQNLIT